MRVYGIKNCDTVRKAMKELAAAGRTPVLVDMRAEPQEASVLKAFFDAFGEPLLNRRSTTWRGLGAEEREGDPVELLSAHPTLMKRPVVVEGEKMTLGWDQAARAAWI